MAVKAKLYSASDIMKAVGIDEKSQFNHGQFTAAVLKTIIPQNFIIRTDVGYKHFFSNYQFIPETLSVSNDIRPDVGIFQGENEKLVCIFEEDSTKNDDFARSITKSCHYSRALCRLKSICGEGQEGVCFVFPSALNDSVRDVQMAVIQVSCRWDYMCCRFSYTGQAIELGNLSSHILSVIMQQQSVVVDVYGDTKFLYKFRDDLSLQYLGYRYNHQYPSARSTVLNVSDTSGNQFVLKFVDSKTFIVLQRLLQEIKHPSILHYLRDFSFVMKYNSYLSALLYEMLEPPLSATDAKKCLKDYIESLHTTLEAVHSFGFEHCDLRLENVCFRFDTDSNSYKIVLIDIDFAVFTGCNSDWKAPLLSLSDLSCLYRGIEDVKSVDYHQLGYLIVWVYRYGTELAMSRGRNKIVVQFNEHYHKMDTFGELAYDKDKFVGELITKGELFSFVYLI